MKIYLDLESKPETLRDLLKKLFSYQVGTTTVKSIETFYDEKCNKIQCGPCKYRSFDDVLICAQTYFPEVDHKELFNTILNLDIKDMAGRVCNIHMGSCSTMERVRMCYYSQENPIYERVIHVSKWESEYSWRELLSEVGITSNEQLQKAMSNKE